MKLIKHKPLQPYYTDINKFVGKINLKDGLVDVADPCYDRDTWCALFDYKVLPGIYNCYIDVANFPYEHDEVEETDASQGKGDVGKMRKENDERIMSLTILHCSCEDNLDNLLKDFEYTEDEIGVDAGLCGFYSHKPDFNDNEWELFWTTLAKYKEYLTCDIREYGVTVSSGFGDGIYNLFELRNANNEIIGLRLDFSDGILDI